MEVVLKDWMKKLISQFEVDWKNPEGSAQTHEHHKMSEEKATLLYLLDCFSKNLFEIESYPLRKVRETLDDFTKNLLQLDETKAAENEKILFKLRQYFSSYRLAEFSYTQKTLEDFKAIIWDFADQLAEDFKLEKKEDQVLQKSLDQLRDAVDANSLHELKTKSREFINQYVDVQSRKNSHKSKRMETVQKNLRSIKKQLLQANQNMRTDHLSGAYNRKSFDEQIKKYLSFSNVNHSNVSLVVLDIDHFKKVNDTYGHQVGDFVIKECVRLLKEIFHRENDFVARIGGEEFAIILPDFQCDQAKIKCQEALDHIRKDVLIHEKDEIRFTVSMGVAQLHEGEGAESWVQRADGALYESKNTGRNKVTISGQNPSLIQVA
jgi:diguanylate cyclase (GGDEF)-like protein